VRINGEFIFGTFEEALNFVSGCTNYEKEHNIGILNKTVIFDTPDLKLVAIKKTDNQSGITIFFKNSTKYDIWKFWQPSGEQLKSFPSITKILYVTDQDNSKFWKSGGVINAE
jgi:hypothetical protein